MELRSGYKKTEVGILPEDWEVRSFEKLFSFKNGVNADRNAYGRGVPFVNVLEPISYSHIYGHEVTGRITLPRSVIVSYVLRLGDILFNRTSETDLDLGLAAAFLGTEEIVFGGFVIRGRPNDDRLDPVYAGYALRAPVIRCQIIPMGQGAVRANIGQQNLGRVLAPLPSLPEQRAIAKALSDMDELLGGLDRLIAKKRDLRQAAMQQLLTGQTRLPGFRGEWEETTLGDIGDCIIGLTYKPEDVVDHGLLVLRSSNVQNGRLSFEDNVYVNLEVPEHLYTQVGDLLICVRNGSRALIGKCAVIDRAAAGLSFGAFMAVYRTKHWRFVVHSFQGDDIQRQIRDNVGATINQITNKDLKAFRLKLPPPGEQTAIAEVLTEMDAELAALEERREKTRALKQGMMQELLTGRTRFTT